MHEPTEPFSILMVEDDRATADMYAIALRRQGYAVQIAGDGWAGLRQALQRLPDLLLLDVHLPGLDGHSVLTLLRQCGDTAGPPTIMLSNDASPAVLRRNRELGVVAHLVKYETTPGELCAAVRSWCERRPAVRWPAPVSE